jgi:hypothetical protein
MGRLLLCFALVCIGLVSASAARAAACPARTGSEIYANPTVTRPAGTAPTGVRFPAICAYPTLTEALAQASGGDRVIADGGTKSDPANFKKETFPLDVPTDVGLTTTDDPAEGGNGLSPAKYVIRFKTSTPGTAVELSSGAGFSGFTVKNFLLADGGALVACDDGSVGGSHVVLDATPNADGDVENGMALTGNCSAVFAYATMRGAHGAGLDLNSTGETTDFALSSFTDNGIGVNLDQATATMTEAKITSNDGDGIQMTDGHLTLQGISKVNGNGYGIEQYGGRLDVRGPDLTSPDSPRLQLNKNAGNGLIAWDGEFDGSDFAVSKNGSSGVQTNGDHVVKMHNVDISRNVGQGIWIVQGAGAEITGGNASGRLSRIRDNGIDGVHLGGVITGPEPARATVDNVDISGNLIGINIRERAAVPYTATLRDNDVHGNRKQGIFVKPADATFEGNMVHDNLGNQIQFHGGASGFAFEINTPGDDCATGVNSVDGYEARGVFGIFAQNQATVPVRHTQFEGGGTGLQDYSAQSGSTINLSDVCP